MPRLRLFTGKGGVGKTTCAAATALESARRGRRTLVVSSDPAHSLGDALDRRIGPEPEAVVENLWAQEVDLYYSMRRYWGNMRELMLSVLRWQGVERIAAEELAALPGMAEASALLWLDQAVESGDYDTIVLDSAPTGETLTLLTLPQVAEWWVAKAFPFQKAAAKTLGFAVRKTTGVPLDRGYEELEALFAKLGRVQRVLGDPTVTSTRIVCNPERMVIQEARRAYTYLQLYGYGVDSVIVNRVLPDEAADGVFAAYQRAQAGYLQEIGESFAPLPILRVPHVGREVFGLDLLREIGAGLYAERAPEDVFFAEPAFRVEPDGAAYVVSVRVPLAEGGDVSAERFGDQLVVQVRNQRRNLLLPNFLAYYTLVGSELDGGWLRARFAPPD